MTAKKIRNTAVIILSANVLYGCGYDKLGDLQIKPKEQIFANIDIGEIKSLYNGTAANIYDDMVIAGYVTANDASGNFYNSFIIEDPTGAVEVKAGIYNLANRFPVGRYVSVKAKGLAIGEYNGVLEIGLQGSGGYQTDYFSHRAIMDMYIFPADKIDIKQPMDLQYHQLEDRVCGRLVRLGPCKFYSEEVGGSSEEQVSVDPHAAQNSADSVDTIWADVNYDGEMTTGYREFILDTGDVIAVPTSGYADFAFDALPTGRVMLTGILMRGKTDRRDDIYMVKLRDAADVEIL